MNTIDLQGEVCILTLNNKPNNYLKRPEFVSIDELTLFMEKHKCKAIIIHGAGRHFSAGADVKELHAMVRNDSVVEEMEKGKALIKAIQQFQVPVVSAVEGACFGGGLELVLASDIRIASTKALFAFPEVNIDLIPGLGGTIHLPQQIGKANAMEIILKGDIVDSQSALDLGIIDSIEGAKTTFDHALSMVNSMVKNRPIEVINAVVESVRNAESKPYSVALARETELFCLLAKRIIENE